MFPVKHLFTRFKANGKNQVGECVAFDGAQHAGRQSAFELQHTGIAVHGAQRVEQITVVKADFNRFRAGGKFKFVVSEVSQDAADGF